jgi:hypothetical protein
LKLACEIASQITVPEQLRASAITNARGAAWSNVEFILRFLHETDALTYAEFLNLIAACSYNFAVASTDRAMWYMFRFLDKHRAQIDQDPTAVGAWNEIYARYDERKKEEARRHAEEREKQRREELARAATTQVKPSTDLAADQ